MFKKKIKKEEDKKYQSEEYNKLLAEVAAI
jgi:hypothetical protein